MSPGGLEPAEVDYNYLECVTADGRAVALGYRYGAVNGSKGYARSLLVSDPQRSAFADLGQALGGESTGELYGVACHNSRTFLLTGGGRVWVTGPLDGTPLTIHSAPE